MSPPCQPFTRNNETACRDEKDARTDALLHLINLIGQLDAPPALIALEVNERRHHHEHKRHDCSDLSARIYG